MALHVWIDRDLCIGSGNCVRLSHGAFALDDDGVAEICDRTKASEEQLRLAQRSCPTAAISIDEC
jgi:ferredoxin